MDDYEDRQETRERSRVEMKLLRREMRRKIRESKAERRPYSGLLFWGLILILWGIIIFLAGQNMLAVGDIWKAFLIGLGGIFVIQSVLYFFSSKTPIAIGRLIPGIILIYVGLGFLFGIDNLWSPLTMVVAGIAVLLVSWFLQREMQRRRAAQETLNESEIKYRHIIDNANSIIMEVNPSGDVIFMNKFGLEFFGYQESEILNQNLAATIIQPSGINQNEPQRLIDNIASSPDEFLHVQSENLRKNGEKAWIIWTYKPVFDEAGNLKEILAIGIDNTQQKKASELAVQQLKEQTALEERTRLARDLHDAVSQTLFSTSLIAEVLPKVWERNKDEGHKKLEEIRLMTRGALAEMRTLLFELRPAALADADLNDLLRQLCESVIGKSKVHIDLDVDGNSAVPPDVKVAVYRIAQEALNNIIKHSGATRAQVSLQTTPHAVALQVIDNGRGFDLSEAAPGRFGLTNMKERAAKVNAALQIRSKVNEGTEVAFDWNDGSGEVSHDAVASH